MLIKTLEEFSQNKILTSEILQQYFDYCSINDHSLNRQFIFNMKEIDKKIREKREKDNKVWESSSPTPEAHLYFLQKKGFEIKYKPYNLDKRLSKLISGKRLVIVGPSPHLLGHGMGHLIEDYDFVCRVNEYKKNKKSLKEDYGIRTDILISCMNIPNLTKIVNNYEYVNSCRFLLGSNVTMWGAPLRDSVLGGLSVDHHSIPDSYLFYLYDKVGTVCNTGLNAIDVFLKYDIKEIFVCGFSFYNLDILGEEVYHGEHIDNTTPSQSNIRLDIHDQKTQMKYFRNYLIKDGRLKLDFYLDEVFNVW